MKINRTHAGLFAAALLGFAALVWLANRVTRPGAPEGANPTIRVEIARIYASRPLIDLSRTADLAAIKTNDDLIRLLEREGLGQRLWCGATAAHHREDGRVQYLSGYLQPGVEASHFPHTLAIMRTLAGEPPVSSSVDYSTARILVIPPEVQALEPFAGLDAMMRMP